MMNEIKLLIEELNQPVQEEDLNSLQEEYINLIDEYLKDSDKKVFKEIETNERIILIGDLHNDSIALAQIFDKLSISKEYNYKKAIFVFLGDYFDRGANQLQILRFLLKFKKYSGNKCIILRGNHDNINYEQGKGFYTSHRPHETLDFFKNYFKEKTIFKIKEFFDFLPYFAITKINKQKFIFVHASIPKECYFDKFNLSELSKQKLPLEKENEYKKMLESMLWGRATESDRKNQNLSDEISVEFGSEQFKEFMKKYKLDFMIRGHDVFIDGYKIFYDSKMISLHSTGGYNNETTAYSEIKTPSFAIIKKDGEILIENMYLYKIRLTSKDNKILKPFNKYMLTKEKSDIYCYLASDLEIYPNGKNTLSEAEAEKLFKSNDEFSIEINVSENAEILLETNFRDFLFNNTKQK